MWAELHAAKPWMASGQRSSHRASTSMVMGTSISGPCRNSGDQDVTQITSAFQHSLNRKCSTNLRAAVLDLGEQVEAVADGDRRLAGHEPHPHQSQADPRQPILTSLTVGVEKGSDALENRRRGCF